MGGVALVFLGLVVFARVTGGVTVVPKRSSTASARAEEAVALAEQKVREELLAKAAPGSVESSSSSPPSSPPSTPVLR
jgi:Na+-transporting methylmalonyl-CoA/oxaloacetate decarboxylase gamma subunit